MVYQVLQMLSLPSCPNSLFCDSQAFDVGAHADVFIGATHTAVDQNGKELELIFLLLREIHE